MRITRRTFSFGAVAGIATPLLGGPLALAREEKSVVSVSDGNLVMPVSFALPDVPKAEAEALLAANGLSTSQLEPECNLTLLRDGDRLVLFDAGSGPHFMPTAGKLVDTLAGEGVAPEDITDVIFTHAHPDHLWGIVDDFDEIAFPEAKLHMGRTEWDFWRSGDLLEKIGESRQVFAVGAQNRLEMMDDRVQLFNSGAEVVPGVEAVDTSGHTPGHMSFAIHDGGEYVMVVGDALTNHAFSFQRPDWPSGSDQDSQKAIATRRSLLDRLAGDRAQIIGFHLPNGGEGRVEQDGTAFRFVQGG